MAAFEEHLADFAANRDAATLSVEVVEAAKAAILDTVGVGIRGSAEPAARAVAASVLSAGGAGVASVWAAKGGLVPATQAALANGTAAHAIEMDDRMPALSLHPGCFVVPSAIASIEASGGTGLDLLAAVAAGYGIAVAVGRSVKLRPGFHESAHKGTWAAVAAAARGFGLDEQRTLDAFGIAATMASSTGAYGDDPRAAPMKSLHGGLGARNGVLAAELAARGLPGPANSLTSPRGYFAVFGDGTRTPDTTQIDEALLYREIKPYAAWGGGHLIIDAVAELPARVLANPGNIEDITIEGSAYLVRDHDNVSPRSAHAARFSGPVLAAIALVDGPGALMDPGIWTDALLIQEDISRLASRVTMVVDKPIDDAARRSGGYGRVRMTVQHSNEGKSTVEIGASRGTLGRPMTLEDVRTKYLALVEPVFGRTVAHDLHDTVMRLDSLESLRSLSSGLRGESHGA